MHVLNAFGLATLDIVRNLEGVCAGAYYSWEPAGSTVVEAPVDDELTDLYDLADALEGVIPHPPPPLPPATNWKATVQLVRISVGGPRKAGHQRQNGQHCQVRQYGQ